MEVNLQNLSCASATVEVNLQNFHRSWKKPSPTKDTFFRSAKVLKYVFRSRSPWKWLQVTFFHVQGWKVLSPCGHVPLAQTPMTDVPICSHVPASSTSNPWWKNPSDFFCPLKATKTHSERSTKTQIQRIRKPNVKKTVKILKQKRTKSRNKLKTPYEAYKLIMYELTKTRCCCSRPSDSNSSARFCWAKPLEVLTADKKPRSNCRRIVETASSETIKKDIVAEGDAFGNIFPDPALKPFHFGLRMFFSGEKFF